MSATLRLTRPFRVADAGRPYQIVLDGEAAGEIRNKSTAEIPVAAGEHTVQVRLLNIVTRRPGRGSPVVTFEAGDGETAEFACRAPRYPQAWWSYIAAMLGGQDRWIQLEEAQ